MEAMESDLELSGAVAQQLQNALLNAFPQEEALGTMVYNRLNVRLNEIASGGNLREIVFSLIEWAAANGLLRDLVRAALAENPGNKRLRDFANLHGIPLPGVIPLRGTT